MKTIEIISYAISSLFLALLVKATVKVILNNLKERKNQKKSEAVKAEINDLKKMGLKEFRFGPKKDTLIMAPDYKTANSKYQSSLRIS